MLCCIKRGAHLPLSLAIAPLPLTYTTIMEHAIRLCPSRLCTPDMEELDKIDIRQWIRLNCRNYAEAAEFLGVSESAVKKWMVGIHNPPETAKHTIFWYQQAMRAINEISNERIPA